MAVIRPPAYESGLHDKVRDFLTIAVLIAVAALLLALAHDRAGLCL
jgi:hypothetical protein